MTDLAGFVSNVGTLGSSSEFSSAHRQQIRDGIGRFAGGWGVAWQGLADIDAHVYAALDNLHQTIQESAQALVDEMVSYMKSHAPWQDQTGNARESLQGSVVWEDEDHFTIFLGYGSDIYYGIWLEVRFGGRYAIVVPTVQAFAPQLAAKIVGGRG